MPDAPTELTLALVLTAAGATLSSALVTGVTEIIKRLTTFDAIRVRWTAFILSALLVIIAFVTSVEEKSMTTGFAAFIAWYGIARLALANYDDATAKVNSLRGPRQ